MRCPYCKEELPEEGSNCPHCGAPIDRSLKDEEIPKEVSEPKKKEKKPFHLWRRLKAMVCTVLVLFAGMAYAAIKNWSSEDTLEAVTQLAEGAAELAYEDSYDRILRNLPFSYEPEPLGTYDLLCFVKKNGENIIFLELAKENGGIYAYRETEYLLAEGDREALWAEAEQENERWQQLDFVSCDLTEEGDYLKAVRTAYRLELQEHYWAAENLGILPFFAEDGVNLQTGEVSTQLKLSGYFQK